MGEVPHHGVVKLRSDETALTLEVLLALPQKGIRLLTMVWPTLNKISFGCCYRQVFEVVVEGAAGDVVGEG